MIEKNKLEYCISILDGQSYKCVHGQIITHHYLYRRQEKLHVSNCLLCVWTAMHEYLSFLGFSNCVLMDYYVILKLIKIDKYKFLILPIDLTKPNEMWFINGITKYYHDFYIWSDLSICQLTFYAANFIHLFARIPYNSMSSLQYCPRCFFAFLFTRTLFVLSINKLKFYLDVDVVFSTYIYTKKTRRGILIWQTKDIYLRDLHKCRQWIRQYHNSSSKDPWMVNVLEKWWPKQTY